MNAKLKERATEETECLENQISNIMAYETSLQHIPHSLLCLSISSK